MYQIITYLKKKDAYFTSLGQILRREKYEQANTSTSDLSFYLVVLSMVVTDRICRLIKLGTYAKKKDTYFKSSGQVLRKEQLIKYVQVNISTFNSVCNLFIYVIVLFVVVIYRIYGNPRFPFVSKDLLKKEKDTYFRS